MAIRPDINHPRANVRPSYLRLMPPAPAHDQSARFEPLPSDANLAQNIAVFEFAFGKLKHGRIADCAGFQPADIGAAEGRCRGSCERPALMVPGEVYGTTIELFPTANLFCRGHRLQLDISSGNFPHFEVN